MYDEYVKQQAPAEGEGEAEKKEEKTRKLSGWIRPARALCHGKAQLAEGRIAAFLTR